MVNQLGGTADHLLLRIRTRALNLTGNFLKDALRRGRSKSLGLSVVKFFGQMGFVVVCVIVQKLKYKFNNSTSTSGWR